MGFDERESLAVYSDQTFESIKHINEDGIEFWYARELAQILQYADWRNFENAIYKAMESCKNSGNEVEDHFGEVTTFTKMNTGARRKISDYALSRSSLYPKIMPLCHPLSISHICNVNAIANLHLNIIHNHRSPNKELSNAISPSVISSNFSIP